MPRGRPSSAHALAGRASALVQSWRCPFLLRILCIVLPSTCIRCMHIHICIFGYIYVYVYVFLFICLLFDFYPFFPSLFVSSPLRVEFFLKTDSGYRRDVEATLFTLANPEHSLRFNTHWSGPPVFALARSVGPRKMSQSPVSRNSNIERRMDWPGAVVGVIRGVA